MALRLIAVFVQFSSIKKETAIIDFSQVENMNGYGYLGKVSRLFLWCGLRCKLVNRVALHDVTNLTKCKWVPTPTNTLALTHNNRSHSLIPVQGASSLSAGAYPLWYSNTTKIPRIYRYLRQVHQSNMVRTIRPCQYVHRTTCFEQVGEW